MIKSKTRSTAFALLLVLVFFCPFAPAHENDDNVITMGYPEKGWPPYLLPAGGFREGIITDLLRTALHGLGYHLRIVHYPENRKQRLLESGVIDFWPKAMEWMDSPEQYAWTPPILAVEDVLVFRTDSKHYAESLNTLEEVRLSTILGYSYPALDAAFSSGKLIRVDAPSAESQLEMLLRRRADAAVMNRWVALWTMATTPRFSGQNFLLAPKAVDNVWYRLMFSRSHGHETVVKHLATELDAMRNDGRYTQVLNRYRVKTSSP